MVITTIMIMIITMTIAMTISMIIIMIMIVTMITITVVTHMATCRCPPCYSQGFSAGTSDKQKKTVGIRQFTAKLGFMLSIKRTKSHGLPSTKQKRKHHIYIYICMYINCI